MTRTIRGIIVDPKILYSHRNKSSVSVKIFKEIWVIFYLLQNFKIELILGSRLRK